MVTGRIKKLEKGFEYLDISNRSARAKIALQGAHLFHYERPGEKPLLWLSEKSLFCEGKAIRGGVPVCWPWFGTHKTDSSLPQHGFARVSRWELLEIEESDEYSTAIKLRLRDSAATMKLWPFRFEVIFAITAGQKLTMALTTINRDDKPFEITTALHSYFRVADIADVHIKGLDETVYFDKLTGEYKTQNGKVQITSEVDRIYQHVSGPLALYDGERTVHIAGKGSSTVVVWNPWQEKCAAMSDMNNNAYRTMLCVETANALDDARIIQPGERHEIKTVIYDEGEPLPH